MHVEHEDCEYHDHTHVHDPVPAQPDDGPTERRMAEYRHMMTCRAKDCRRCEA